MTSGFKAERGADGIFDRQQDGVDKVVDLESAIDEHVKPGMTLYLGSRANACIRALLRRFWGSHPNFTLVVPALSLSSIHLLYAGLARKVVTAYYGAGYYPYTGPSPIVQDLRRQGRVEFEDWSLLALTQRLMAGALGLPFLPTHSLLRSSMAEENPGAFSLIEDPFGSGMKVGAVKALNPDLALAHCWASDRYGYCVTAPSVDAGDCRWGIKASRLGAIVTAERVLTTGEIRRYARVVDVPGYMVQAVVEAPLGAHPEPMVPVGIEGIPPYEHDYDFIRECRKASADPVGLERWLREWVLDNRHADYVAKLGSERTSRLKAQPGAVNTDRPGSLARQGFTQGEMMVVVAAREVERLVRERGFKVLVSGLGLPALASWLAYYQMRARGLDVDLMTGTGFIGFSPRPGDTCALSMANLSTSKMSADILEIQGVMVGGRSSRCLAVLNAAQVDMYGNLNSSVGPDGAYLVGSGGATDAGNAPEVLVVMPQSAARFVDRLPYITTPGTHVSTVVSDMGVFQKRGSSGELTLARHFVPNGQGGSRHAVGNIRRSCGWPLKTFPGVSPVPPPRADELRLLRLLDPEGLLGRG